MQIDPLSKKLFSGAGHDNMVSLMDHSISSDKARPNSRWSVPFGNFCGQLSLLKDPGWTTICAHQLKTVIKSLLPKTVLIIFADGYANKFPAVKMLTKHNMTASWFIVTKDIGHISYFELYWNALNKVLILNRRQLFR